MAKDTLWYIHAVIHYAQLIIVPPDTPHNMDKFHKDSPNEESKECMYYHSIYINIKKKEDSVIVFRRAYRRANLGGKTDVEKTL